MTMTLRAMEEQERALRAEIKKRYFWAEFELRRKGAAPTEYKQEKN